MTRVVNCKHTAYDIYVGRRRNAGCHHFGNPFSHLSDNSASVKVSSREQAIAYFEGWLKGECWLDLEQERRRWILANLPRLKDKVLGCHCVPESCHGEVLARMADKCI